MRTAIRDQDHQIQQEQEQILQVNQQRHKPMSRGRKILYIVLLVAMIGSTALNILANKPKIIDYQQFEILLTQSQKQDRKIRQETDLVTRLQLQYNSSKYNIPLSDKVKQRISYGQPRPKNYFIRATIITKKSQPLSSNQCILTNGISIISNKTTATAKQFLAQPQAYRWILLLSNVDIVADGIVKKMMEQTNNIYQLKNYDIVVDSDYQFILSHTRQCQSITYLHNNFIIDQQDAKQIILSAKSLKSQLKDSYVGFTSVTKSQSGTRPLQDLRKTNLYQFKQEKFNQYVYIFDPNFLRFIAPINFIHFNKHTIQQLIINPLLTITQNSTHLAPINKAVHLFDQAVVQFKQFQLKQPNKPVDKSASFCFVSYPSDPAQFSQQQLNQYINSLKYIQANNADVTAIVYLPYIFSQKKSLIAAYNKLKQVKDLRKSFRLKLRPKQFKAVAGFAAYQSAYGHCPQTSLMITSRHNVKFNKDFLTKLSQHVSQKYHYYYSGNIKTNQPIQNYLKAVELTKRFDVQKYLSDFSTVQIFKVQLLKMIHVWALKSDQNQFYESEASFALPLIQMTGTDIYIQQIGYQQSKKRKPTLKQMTQLSQLQNYAKWDKINNNVLQPIAYNSLTNLDLRRGTLDVIPKIIHQVWMKEQSLSDQTLKLQRTVIQVNKDYKYMIWKRQNLTFHDFPMSYSFVARTLEHQWASRRSYHPWTQALISYQALYNHGGIYLALNAQAIKPLDPFLKYQLFFAGFYNTIGQYGPPMSVGRQVIGVKRYSYHLRMVLTEIITVQRMNFELTDYQALIGGDILRVSLTNSEVFTTTYFGFHLFTYDPFRTTKGLCDKSQPPCKQYSQAYVVIHNLI